MFMIIGMHNWYSVLDGKSRKCVSIHEEHSNGILENSVQGH